MLQKLKCIVAAYSQINAEQIDRVIWSPSNVTEAHCGRVTQSVLIRSQYTALPIQDIHSEPDHALVNLPSPFMPYQNLLVTCNFEPACLLHKQVSGHAPKLWHASL